MRVMELSSNTLYYEKGICIFDGCYDYDGCFKLLI